MNYILSRILIILFSSIGGGVLGIFLGALIGGNYAPQFSFNGVQGYEAAGQLGLIIGAVIGGVAGYLLKRRTSGN